MIGRNVQSELRLGFPSFGQHSLACVVNMITQTNVRVYSELLKEAKVKDFDDLDVIYDFDDDVMKDACISLVDKLNRQAGIRLTLQC